MDDVSIRGRLRKLWQAIPVALRILVAAIVLVGVVLVAIVVLAFAAVAAMEVGIKEIVTGLLFLLLFLLSGLWLLTRLSLFAPALSREHLGPVAALRRSNELVRGHFWLVSRTATLAFLLEEATDEPVALAAELVFGSWGAWIGSSIVSTLVTPLAAITTSLTTVSRCANSGFRARRARMKNTLGEKIISLQEFRSAGDRAAGHGAHRDGSRGVGVSGTLGLDQRRYSGQEE